MIDIRRIRENPKEVEEAIRKKGAAVDIGAILKLDEVRRNLVTELDVIRAKQNRASDEIPKLQDKEREGALVSLKELKEAIASKEFDLKRIEEDLGFALLQLPNPPLEDVPVGKDERDNVVLREEGEKPKFSAQGGSASGGDFQPKDYLALAETLGIIDVERAGKVSGSRFGYLKGDAALLEFALIDFGTKILANSDTLSRIASDAGLSVGSTPFIPVIPPVLMRPEMLGRMGYLRRNPKSQIPNPKIEERKAEVEWVNEEVYFLRDDDLVLAGTSEQSIGPMHADEIFAEKDLPRRYLGFSSCFRREAGSYGKDTKGILRVHQFDKLEMFSYAKPEDSIAEHKFMLACEEYLMKNLKIPYRVVNICAGDLGVPAAAKFDIEAWMPGQDGGKGQYRETHSTSNTTDFQARRLNIRYRKPDGGLEFVHMLNGTALAIGRMIIAVMENYQTEDGKIRAPDAIKEFLGKDIIG